MQISLTKHEILKYELTKLTAMEGICDSSCCWKIDTVKEKLFLASNYNEDFSVKLRALLCIQCYIKPLKFPGQNAC